MKYSSISNNLFTKNRSKLSSRLPTGSIAILHSNFETPRNGDAFFAFRQQSDVFYLSGVDQEDTIVVLFPDCPNPNFREFIFVKETNEQIAVWDGARLTPNQVYEVSGIQNVFWYHEFWQTIHSIILMAEKIMVNLNENDRFFSEVSYSNFWLTEKLKSKYPAHSFGRLAPILSNLRMQKEVEEIELLKEAIDITHKGLLRALKFVKPGVMEYEVEAEIIHEFVRNRSKGFAFDPIIASGESACVLHYIENNKPCKDGDLMLLDFGAEYANYNGDLTRCIPVNGKFSTRQKEVYNAVLDVQRFAKSVLKSGKTLPGLKYYLPINLTMKYRNPFIHGTLVIKKRILKKLGGYNSNFKYSQDYKLIKDLIDEGYKISIMKQKLYNLNMEGNISSLKKVEQEYYAKCVRKNINP